MEKQQKPNNLEERPARIDYEPSNKSIADTEKTKYAMIQEPLYEQQHLDRTWS
jgi:hypothetical protein